VPALCAPRIDEANHARDGDQALLSDGRGGGRAHKTSEKLALVYMDGGPRKTAPIERAESKARFPFSSGWLVGKKKKSRGSVQQQQCLCVGCQLYPSCT
jgi:hypothetical protein